MPKNKDDKGLKKHCTHGVRGWSSCTCPWFFNFRHKGENYRFSLERQVTRLIRKTTRKGQPIWVRDLDSLGAVIDNKDAALIEAPRLRAAIKAGTIQAVAGPSLERLTMGQLLATYYERYIEPQQRKDEKADAVSRARALENATYQIAAITRTKIKRPDGILQAFGTFLLRDITKDTIERLREARLMRVPVTIKTKKDKDVTRLSGGLHASNRDLALCRAAFNWAIVNGYCETTPFKRGTETVVKLGTEIPRDRRLEGDENDRLLTACTNPLLRALVEAALETGCRKGELLSFQVHQVRWNPKAEIVLPARKTKTKKAREIPISSRLKTILEMRETALRTSGDIAPDKPLPAELYLFGNDLGQRVASIKTAWKLALKRAKIQDLHFHDLRREAASRWLDGGVPLHRIQKWLGHSTLAQTSTYLRADRQGDGDDMRRFEEGRHGAAPPPASAPAQESTTTVH